MEIQVSTIKQPILITPRIAGKIVTVTQIKSTYSYEFVNDTDTPMKFHLEYETLQAGKTVIDAAPELSSDAVIGFNIPDAVYSTITSLTVMFFWTVTDAVTPPYPVIEKIYTKQPMILEVTDFHRSA